MAVLAKSDITMRGGMPEKRWVGPSFSRAAYSYDRVAALQRQVGEALLDRLSDSKPAHRTILDVGAGTGYCASRLAKRYPDAVLLALDIALGMLKTFDLRPDLRQKALRICGDGEVLPLRDCSVDLVFSNLTLQWCPGLVAAMQEFRRVLRPGGLLLFTTFGESTLFELRDAWAKADSHTHVNDFHSPLAIEEALTAAHFSGYTVNSEIKVVNYADVHTVLRELKNMGAHNVTALRPRHLTGKGVFNKMIEAYAASMPQGMVKASFEIVYGEAYRAG